MKKLPRKDSIRKNWQAVYEMRWDSGGPGAGADVECMYRHDGTYAVVLSYADPIGPIDSFEAALKAGSLDYVSDAVTDIVCLEIEAVELARLLRAECPVGFIVPINGTLFRVNDDLKFEPIQAD